jgi:hypothetical protein
VCAARDGVPTKNFEDAYAANRGEDRRIPDMDMRNHSFVDYVNDEASLVNDHAKLGAAKKDYAILPTSISVEPLAFDLKKGELGLKNVVDGVLREHKTGPTARSPTSTA